MIKGKKVLGLIPARGGSKRLPRKNILPFGGFPLIKWTIDAARNAHSLDYFILSSDDDEIIDVAREFGCDAPFRRPASLSTDLASSVDVALHALDYFMDYDWIVLLQPTSPLRTSHHIDEVVNICEREDVFSCVSVYATADEKNKLFYIGKNGCLQDFQQDVKKKSTGDARKTYSLNGAIYVVHKKFLEKNKSFFSNSTRAYVMPQWASIDIDTSEDFEVATQHLKNSTKNE